MTSFRYSINSLIFALLLPCALLAQEPAAASAKDTAADTEQQKYSGGEVPVEVVADQLEYVKDQSKVIGRGNVVVTYKELRLQSDYAEVYTEKKEATADGHVTIFQADANVSGEHADYDLIKHTGKLPAGTAFQFPWYGSGEKLNQVSKDKIIIQNATVTTCNYSRPHYDIFAKSVDFYPDDKIVMKNVQFRILGKTFFWLPQLTIPLDDRNSFVEVSTGYSDNWGFYALVGKTFALSKNVKARARVDYRSKRGMAYGVDVGYDVPNFGRGKIITYLTKDKRAPVATLDPLGNPFVTREERTRYRLTWRHRTDFKEDTNLIINYHELQDEFILQDFFPGEERRENRPRTQFVLTETKEDYSFFSEVVLRTNKFYDEIEKLPRLNFTWRDQPLFDTNMLYKNQTEFGNYKKTIARTEGSQEVMRYHTRHEMKYPFSFFDKRFKVTPYGNVAAAYYDGSIRGDDSFSRVLLGHGIETRTRFQRQYDYKGEPLGIKFDKVRHIVEPIIRYDALRTDKNNREDRIVVDSFDELRKHDVVQFALDNRIQTLRNSKKTKGLDQRVDVVSYTTYVNYEFNGGRHGGSGVTDWGHHTEFRPYDWLIIEGDTVFDLTYNDIREHLFDLIFDPSEDGRYQIILSHGYLRKDPRLPGSESSNILIADLIYKINDLWRIGGYVRTELSDREIEEWEIRAIRDLHDFLLSFGVNSRNSDFTEGNNTEFFVSLTMKQFSDIGFGLGHRSSLSTPRIGRFYAGSNVDESGPSDNYGAF